MSIFSTVKKAHLSCKKGTVDCKKGTFSCKKGTVNLEFAIKIKELQSLKIYKNN